MIVVSFAMAHLHAFLYSELDGQFEECLDSSSFAPSEFENRPICFFLELFEPALPNQGYSQYQVTSIETSASSARPHRLHQQSAQRRKKKHLRAIVVAGLAKGHPFQTKVLEELQ